MGLDAASMGAVARARRARRARRSRRAARRRQAGYSLVELALVLGISAFMILQAAPAMLERIAAQGVDRTVNGITLLANAAVAYRADERFLDAGAAPGGYGSWPGDLDDLLGLGQRPGCDTSNPNPLVPDCPNYLGAFDGRNGFGRGYAFTTMGEALVIETAAPEPYSLSVAYRIGANAEHVDAVPPATDGTVRVHLPPPGQESVHAHYAMLDGSRPFVGDVTIGAPTAGVVIGQSGDLTATGTLEADSFRVDGNLTVDGSLSLTGNLNANEIVADEIDAARFCYGTC